MKIVKITAIWCSACLIMNKVLEELDDIEITSLDYDFDFEKVEKYNVGKVLPVFILLDENDNEVRRIEGEHTKEEMIKFIRGED